MNNTALVTSFKNDDELMRRFKAFEEKLLALIGQHEGTGDIVTRHKPGDSPLNPADSIVHSAEEIKALLDKLNEIEMRFKS